jgi:preflagellin peptidase FlaK
MVFEMQILTATRIATALLFLSHASWSDYKIREASDATWIALAPLGFTLTFAETYLYEPSQLIFYGICFALTVAFATAIFYLGGFGGADAKALMCLALVLPFYPADLLKPFLGGVSPTSQMVFPFTVFSNAVLLSALSAVAMILFNVFWRWKTGRKLFADDYENKTFGRKLLILITGYKVSIKKLKEKWHVYPLEDIEEKSENVSKRKLIVLPKDEGRDDVVKRLEKAVKVGTIQDSIWATPGLPFLIFVTSGLILALFVGDIIWIFIRLLLI